MNSTIGTTLSYYYNLVVEVFKQWEVLASIGALVLVASLLGLIAHPKDRPPRSLIPKSKAPSRTAAKAPAEVPKSDEDEEDAPPRKRAALVDDDDEVVE